MKTSARWKEGHDLGLTKGRCRLLVSKQSRGGALIQVGFRDGGLDDGWSWHSINIPRSDVRRIASLLVSP